MTGGTKRLWLPWVNAMTTVLSDGEAVQRKGAGSKTFLDLTKLGLEPELLAIITCQNVLNLLMLPCFRNKDEMQENARYNRFGEVPFATAATRVGEALRLSRELLVGPCLPGCICCPGRPSHCRCSMFSYSAAGTDAVGGPFAVADCSYSWGFMMLQRLEMLAADAELVVLLSMMVLMSVC